MIFLHRALYMRNKRGKSQVCVYYSTFFCSATISPLPWCFQSFCVTSKDLLFQGHLRCYIFSAILSFYWSFIPDLSSLPFPGNLDHLPYFSPDSLNLCPIKCSTKISSMGHDKYCAVHSVWMYTLLICSQWKALLDLAATVNPRKIYTHLSSKLQTTQRSSFTFSKSNQKLWVGFKVTLSTVLLTTDL